MKTLLTMSLAVFCFLSIAFAMPATTLSYVFTTIDDPAAGLRKMMPFLETRSKNLQENDAMNNATNIFEALGVGYVLASTTFFTVEVIYVAAKGVRYVHRLVQRAQVEETLDLQRSLSIKRELADIDE